MQFDWWVILVIIIGIVGALVAIVIAEDARTLRGFVTGALVLWFVGYGVVTGIANMTNGSQANTNPPRSIPLTSTYVAGQMGFDSGKQYPLLLGGRTGGSTGELSTTVHAGFFSATATVQNSTAPASAVSLSYSYEGKSYILELPTSRVTFVQSETATPSATIWLSGAQDYKLGEAKVDESKYPYRSCEWKFNNLLFMCLWPSYKWPAPTPVINQHVLDVGLAPVVADSFDRAQITLTPEMYRQLLGVIE